MKTRPEIVAIPVDVVDALARALAAALVERYRHDEAIRNPAPRRGNAQSADETHGIEDPSNVPPA